MEDEDEEVERQAKKKLRERQVAECAANLEWSRQVAPPAAHIYYRHFRHCRPGPSGGAESALCFGSVVLSLVHSDAQYIEDLSERLSETQDPAEVDASIKRLHDLAEAFTSPDGVDEACAAEFMRVFEQALLERRGCQQGYPRGWPAE